MEKDIITTLFLMFIAYSFVLLVDIGTLGTLFVAGLATLLGMLAFVDGEVE